jgi:hypothetical protein
MTTPYEMDLHSEYLRADLFLAMGQPIEAAKVLEAVLAAEPELEERVYRGWRGLGYRHPDAGYVCGVFPRADGVSLLFERGAELDEPVLTGEGTQTRQLELRPGDSVDRALVASLVRRGVDHGVRRRHERGRDG